MKKLVLGLFFVALITSVMAQQFPTGASNGKTQPATRDNEFICLPNPVFSQVYPTLDNGIFCQLGYYYYIAADNYSATGPFSTMRFWGGVFYGCTMAPTEMFDIKIWNGDPNAGGTLVNSFTKPGTVTPTTVNFIGTPFYQIDIDFGTSITQLNGWIGITRNGTSCDPVHGFGWASFGADGNSISFGGGSWALVDANLEFCLGGGGQAETPISNWALFIGIGLILAFAVVRFRRVS
jgi:hypothetical protein